MGNFVIPKTTSSPTVPAGGTFGQILAKTNEFDFNTQWINNTDLNAAIGTGTINYLSKFTGSNTLGNSLLFDNGTKVGIGTTTPASLLDVNGQVLIGNGNKTQQSTFPLYISGSTGLGWKAAKSDGTAVFELYAGFSGINEVRLLNNQDLAGYSDSGITNKFKFFGATGNGYFAGNLGIGTISPTYRLDIPGTTALHAMRSYVGYDIYPVPEITTYATATVVAGGAMGIGNYYYGVTYVTALGETHLVTNGVAVVTTSGNQAVNLSNIPVSSDSRVTSRKIYRSLVNGQYYNIYLVATIADNVTTTYLDTIADASLGTLNAFFRVNTTTNNITVGGAKAMVLDSNNVAFGIGATLQLTAGGRITAIGTEAGRANTTGGENTYLGFNAGYGVTTGSANTYIGVYTATAAGSTATYNVAVGRSALGKVTSGGLNTAIGTFSGYENTIGYENVFLGYYAGAYLNNGTTPLTSATYGTYIGRTAKGLSATETNAIVIGFNALGLGSNTTVIGNASTLKTVLWGNLGIGETSPLTTLDIRTSSNSPITPLASVPNVATTVLIGNTGTYGVLAIGHNNTGQAWLQGRSRTAGAAAEDILINPLGGNVGIGTTSPAYKLDVFGIASSAGGVNSNIGYNITPVVAPIAGMTATPVAGSGLNIGQYYYAITYYNSLGETNAYYGISAVTTAGNQQVNLASIPISTNTTVIGRKIYRGKVGEGTVYGGLIATIANNTATTYSDTIPDSSVPGGIILDRAIYGKPNLSANYISVNSVRSLVVDTNLTAVGYGAGTSVTNAPQSTFVGAGAGVNVTSGAGNTLVGKNAGSSITTGSQNSILGDTSGNGITTGSYNIGLGPNVLNSAVAGSFNIAMGYYTMNKGTGSYNILLGGYNWSSGTPTASYCTFIGGSLTNISAATNYQVNINDLITGISSGTKYVNILGSLGIGLAYGTAPVASAQVQIDSTAKGFLPPRMTTLQKIGITLPAIGLVIYDTDLNKLCVFTTAWETVTSI